MENTGLKTQLVTATAEPLKLHSFKGFAYTTVTVLMGGFSAVASANTGLQGLDVISGNVSSVTDGAKTTISSFSQNAVVNWNTFDVAAEETVNFVLPSADSSLLNRVLSPTQSTIAGEINVNQGKVYLVNPNGIIFSGKTNAYNSFDTGSFIMSSIELDPTAFLKGQMVSADGRQFLAEDAVSKSVGVFTLDKDGVISYHDAGKVTVEPSQLGLLASTSATSDNSSSLLELSESVDDYSALIGDILKQKLTDKFSPEAESVTNPGADLSVIDSKPAGIDSNILNNSGTNFENVNVNGSGTSVNAGTAVDNTTTNLNTTINTGVADRGEKITSDGNFVYLNNNETINLVDTTSANSMFKITSGETPVPLVAFNANGQSQSNFANLVAAINGVSGNANNLKFTDATEGTVEDDESAGLQNRKTIDGKETAKIDSEQIKEVSADIANSVTQYINGQAIVRPQITDQVPEVILKLRDRARKARQVSTESVSTQTNSDIISDSNTVK